MLTRLGLAFLAILASSGVAQAQQCLHGENETAAERNRIAQAIYAIRMINSAESNHKSTAGQFANLSELATSPVMTEFRDQNAGTFRGVWLDATREALPGFELRLLSDGMSYVVVIRDQTDPCRLTLVSDNDGVMYTAKPTQ
jgi:hypothetical protein